MREIIAIKLFERFEDSVCEWDEAGMSMREPYYEAADAVLDAMRDPTWQMVHAGGQAFDDTLGETEACWRAMIDAAKEDKK